MESDSVPPDVKKSRSRAAAEAGGQSTASGLQGYAGGLAVRVEAGRISGIRESRSNGLIQDFRRGRCRGGPIQIG